MSLIARHLEQNGLPTLCLGSAKDILLAGRPPRAVFVDYPLGHSAGKPFDRDDQFEVVSQALAHLEAMGEPGTLIELPQQWSADDTWKRDAVDPGRGDTRQARDTTPQYQFDADRLLAEANGAPMRG